MENENNIDPARGMSWCKIHKYWWSTKDGCPDCQLDAEPRLNKCTKCDVVYQGKHNCNKQEASNDR